MPLTLDQLEIDQACTNFEIDKYEYYLEFTTNGVIYMHWISTVNKVIQYIQDLPIQGACMDIQIHNKWIPLDNVEPDFKITTPYVNCRYILAA